MLLIRKSRKLIAQYTSERQYAFMRVLFPLIRRPCRNTDTGLVNTVFGGLRRTRRARTSGNKINRKVFRCERSRQLRFFADVFGGLSI